MQITNPFTNYINSYVKKPIEIIFDIGSRDLDQSIEFNHIYPNAKIYAIEPNPSQKEECKNKAKNYPNILFFPIAFSKSNAPIDFYEVVKEEVQKLPHETHAPSANIGASSIYGHDQSYVNSVIKEDGLFRCTERKHTVESQTLDSFCKAQNINSIDVIWIDTQGSELEIFSSGLEILKNTRIIHTETQYKTMYKNQPLYPEVKNFFEEICFVEVFNRFSNGPLETDLILVNKNIL